MHVFSSAGGRRVLPSEIKAFVRSEHNAAAVAGFGEFVGSRGASEAASRVAGFLAFGGARAWYLPLGSGGEVVWRSASAPDDAGAKDVLFAFAMGLGNGSPMPQPSGQFDLFINGRRGPSFRVVKHSQTWRSGPCAFHFSAHRIEAAAPNVGMALDDVLANEGFASFGIGLLLVPREWAAPGEPAEIRVVGRPGAPSTRWFLLHSATNVIDRADFYRALDGLFGPRPTAGGYPVFFGDIHTHSGVSTHEPKGCGVGTREENYEYARGPGGLDIYALTDHEWQVGPDGSREYLALADRYEGPGRFVCLPAFEHTSPLYGHRNVYYLEGGGEVVPAHMGWKVDYYNPDVAVSPEQLWARLDEIGIPAFTAPHHPSATSHPLTWQFHDPRYDRLMEVYSVWGSSEYYGDHPRGVSDRFRDLTVRDALARGYRMGLIASSDGHDGHPGNAQSPHIKHHHQYHHLGSGLVGVLASSLTRREVFEALRARRCYGTTGVPIALDFSVNGHVMGSELAALDPGRAPTVTLSCTGANGIDHVRIVKNGRVVLTAACHGEWRADLEWTDAAYDRGRPNWYYARVVQIDRESAWSSPVWIG